MRVEVVAVGTELLLGQVVDTNSGWIAATLAGAGIDVLHTGCVGDNAARIGDELRLALARSDAVIVCGGLGPTQDDLTRDVIASVLEVDLVPDPAVEAKIRAMFAARGREMSSNNLRQALVPAGARLIEEQPGTAPGLVCDVDGKVLYAVPGVPSEMREMVSGTVLRDLRRRAAERGELAVVVSRTLRTWGLAESRLAELLQPRFAALDAAQAAADDARDRRQTPDPVPTIAFLASGGKGILVRLTVKASDAAAAQAALAGEERHVRAVIDDWVFGVDDESMESVTLDLLREAGLSLGAAESLTAGYVAGRLAQIPGASEVLRGSIVSYASDVKHELLGVPAGPVISEQAALAMARGAARVLRADAAVATTGVAGPDTQEGQPVGLVCLAAVTPGGERSATVQLPGGRETVRELAVTSVLDLLRRLLLSQR